MSKFEITISLAAAVDSMTALASLSTSFFTSSSGIGETRRGGNLAALNCDEVLSTQRLELEKIANPEMAKHEPCTRCYGTSCSTTQCQKKTAHLLSFIIIILPIKSG